MELHIARTFVAALAQFTEQQQKAVWKTVGELQDNPDAPGLKSHRLEKPQDPNFWSVRVNTDLRIIIHKTNFLLIVYVGRHEAAYQWAARRRIDNHSRTGALQIVEIPEAVEGSTSSNQAPGVIGQKSLFADLSRHDFLSAGVPEDWIDDLGRIFTEDDFLDIAGHLPPEAAETLLQYFATGEWRVPELGTPADPFANADTLRNFWKVENPEELQRALTYPADQWAIFLHPSQRRLAEMNFAGPARVSGSAGTGKSIVALHRAARLARSNPKSRILFTTYSQTLADVLAHKLTILAGKNSPITSRISVASFEAVADELYQMAFGELPRIATDEQIQSALDGAALRQHAVGGGIRFLFTEWTEVIDEWQITNLYDYVRTPRTGRGIRLGEKQRERLWRIFEATREALDAEGVITRAQAYHRLTEYYRELRQKAFDYILVDEAQDLGVSELRFFAAIAPSAPDALFFAGDLGQRIFKHPFSWKELGIDISGRSHTLKVNYRTSHQIRQIADALLPAVLHDYDGAEEIRTDTVSLFSGPRPVIRKFGTVEEEHQAVSHWIGERLANGVAAAEIAVIVPSEDYLPRAYAAVMDAGRDALNPAEAIAATIRGSGDGPIVVGVLKQVKGFEFKAVAVMACDEKALPLEARIMAATGDSEREIVLAAERQLLYVGCTRAREHLFVSGVAPASPFLKLWEK